jgi:tetratricopeptide (TPR) repeat protein
VYPLISELLIEAYLRVHDYANAERVAADRVTWTEGEYGESSLPVTGWLNRLAEINLLQGKYQEAEPVYLRSLSMHRSLKLDSCLMTRDLYTGLAEIYLALKRPVDAEQLLRSAIDTCPKKDSSRADLLNAYAITLEDNGRLEEAAKAALEADRVDTLDPRFKQEQRDLLRARLLASQGRFDEAVSLCRKWIAIFEVPESPESDRRLMLPLTEYERILRAAGRLSEAAEAGARLKEITTKYRRF